MDDDKERPIDRAEFERDIALLRASMRGGIHEYMMIAFRMGCFATTDDALAYAEEFKRKPEEYIERVADEIARREATDGGYAGNGY